MSASNYDTLVYRLAQMLVKLNQGDKLDPQVLADELGVNQITPIVRYWIPYIRIISPEDLQSEMEQELADYLGRPAI